MKKSKRYAEIATKIEKNKAYAPMDAIKLVKETSILSLTKLLKLL